MTVPADPFATMPPDRPPKPASKTKVATGGRWPTFNGFVDGIMGTLTPAAAFTWFILFRDTKRNGLATASQAYIAKRAGRSDRAIRVAVNELIGRGLLVVVRRGATGRASVYRVALAPDNRKPTSGSGRKHGSGSNRK